MKIKIGDKFYRYIDCGGVFEYVVRGMRTYAPESVIFSGKLLGVKTFDTQYELECQTCTHGYKCLLLCAISDYGKLEFVKMLNDEEGEQKHWHYGAGSFFATINEALVEKGARMSREIDEKIIKAKEVVAALEKQKLDQIKVINDMCERLNK